MLKRYAKIVKDFLSHTEKSTLAVFAAGMIALIIAAPMSNALQADVVTLSDDGSAMHQGSPNGDSMPEGPDNGRDRGQNGYYDYNGDRQGNGNNAPKYDVNTNDKNGYYDRDGNWRPNDEKSYDEGSQNRYDEKGMGRYDDRGNDDKYDDRYDDRGNDDRYDDRGNSDRYDNYSDDHYDDRGSDMDNTKHAVPGRINVVGKSGNNTARIEWKPVEGITQYNVLFKKGRHSKLSQSDAASSWVNGMTYYNLIKLNAGDVWTFQVAPSRNKQVVGEYSGPVVIPIEGPQRVESEADLQKVREKRNESTSTNTYNQNDEYNNEYDDGYRDDNYDNDNNEWDQRHREDELKNWKRDLERLSRDFRWTLRELERSGYQKGVDEYNAFINRGKACEQLDWDCLEDVRWDLDDWAFNMEDKLRSLQCSKDTERMRKDFERHSKEMDREMDKVSKEFGEEALADFKEIVSAFKAVHAEMLKLGGECKFDEMDNLRFDKMDPLEERMHMFWEEWGNKFHEDHEKNMCEKIQKELADEDLSDVPAEKKAEAQSLLDQAKRYAAECDFEALDKLHSKAKKLGLADEDRGIRGYEDVNREDLKGFNEYGNKLEGVFNEMDARDDNLVLERLNKADRTNLNTILEEDDEDILKRKIKFLSNTSNQDIANDFLKQTAELQALIEEVKALKSELKKTLEEYNFYGEEAIAKAKKAAEEGLTDDERRELIEEAKVEARAKKFEDKLIPFKDTDDDHWATDAVQTMVERGIVSGEGSGESYNPGGATIWPAALKIVMETAEHGYSNAGDTGVREWDTHPWAKGYFKKAQELGIPVLETNVNKEITRGELAELIVRALRIPYENTETQVFRDTSTRHPYYKAIQTLNAKGVFNGSDGKARPDDTLNRAEIATFMNNVLEKL